MKTTNSTFKAMFILIFIIALFTNACNQIHSPGKPPKGEKEVKLPCSGKHFAADKKFFRVNSSGESLDQVTSKKKALSNAKGEMAGAINSTMKILGDNFVESTEFNNKEEILEKFVENSRTIISQQLIGTKTVCEMLTSTKAGKYKTYLAIEIPGEELTSAIYDKLKTKEWLKVDYKYEKFREQFEKEMRKFEESN